MKISHKMDNVDFKDLILRHFMQNISIPQDEKTTVEVSNLTVALADLQ